MIHISWDRVQTKKSEKQKPFKKTTTQKSKYESIINTIP